MDDPHHYVYLAQACWSEDYDGLVTLSLTVLDNDTGSTQSIHVDMYHVDDPLALWRAPAAARLERMYQGLGVQLPLPF